jgi:heterotetrameric sarcosine oxidase delta subunit
MQLFTCPWCGPRAQIEFSYARVAESVAGAAVDSQGGEMQELDRIFLRQNSVGLQEEIWQHTHGCRGWLRIRRNNLTHEVLQCTPAGENQS